MFAIPYYLHVMYIMFMNKWRALCSRLQTGPLNYSLTCKRRRHENSFCTYSIILVEGKMNVKHEIRKKWANI
jgi:hypothetical protein